MGVMVIAAFRPLPGKEREMEEVVRGHVEVLRGLGLATQRPRVAMRAGDGTMVEVFEWVSEEAIEAAHRHPVVREMWKQFEAACTNVRLADLKESGKMFPGFEPVEMEV